MTSNRFTLVLACGVALVGCVGDPAPEITPPPPAPASVRWPVFVTPAAVNALALGEDGTVYLGGAFTRIGPMTGGGVPLVGESGQPAGAFPRVDGWVGSAVPDGAGGWYIGGQFARIGGEARGNLAHVLADGTLDPLFAPAATHAYYGGWVSALALDAGVLYVAGVFDTLDGAPRGGLGAVDAGGRVTAWAPAVATTDGTVVNLYALAIRGGEIIVAGRFNTVDGEPRSWLAALRPDGVLTAWNPGATAPYLGGVDRLAVVGDVVFAAGSFDVAGGQPRPGLVALDPSGAATPWSPALAGEGWVDALAADGGTLYIGGRFTAVDGQPRTGLAAFDVTGALLPWNPAVEAANVVELAAGGGVVYLEYVVWNPRFALRLAAFDAAGARTAWDPDVGEEGMVMTLAASAGQVFAGGTFRWIGRTSRRNGLAAIGSDGRVTDWNPGLDLAPLASGEVPAVHALAVLGGAVYVGGAFDRIGGQARRNLAAVDGAGAVTAWNSGASGPVYALAVRGDLLHVGGRFDRLGGLGRANLAAVRATGDVTAWDPRPNQLITSLATDGAVLYAGGYFTAMGGIARSGLAAFGADGTLLPWSPALAGAAGIAEPSGIASPAPGVWAVAVAGPAVYAAGDFASAGGMARQRLAALDVGTGVPTAFATALPGPLPALALGVSGQVLHAGGYFDGWFDGAVVVRPALVSVSVAATGGVPSPALLSFTETMLDPNSPYHEDPHVGAIAVREGVAYVGGRFWGEPAGPDRRWNVAAIDGAGHVEGWDPSPAP
jgi:hypothetical protein